MVDILFDFADATTWADLCGVSDVLQPVGRTHTTPINSYNMSDSYVALCAWDNVLGSLLRTSLEVVARASSLVGMSNRCQQLHEV